MDGNLNYGILPGKCVFNCGAEELIILQTFKS
jgi:hypothetical protein